MNPLVTFVRVPLLLLAASSLHAADWPQWLGPERNGHYPDHDVALPWPDQGPRQVWKIEVGQGFSGPVAQGGKVILFHRLENREAIDELDASSGRRLWRSEYPSGYRDDFGFDEGPRATPAIAGGRVFAYGALGMLTALDLESGKTLWQVDTRARFNTPKGFFGMASSPLVHDSQVLVNLGAPDGAGVVAFDTATGEVKWKASRHEASYASPVLATVRETPYLFFYNRESLEVLTPEGGEVFAFPWRPSMNASVNAATPLVIGDLVFLSTSYGKGAVLLRFRELGPEVVWKSDDALSNHYSTSLHHEGFLYGFHGRQEQGAVLRCVELRTGKVRWSEPGLGSGWVLEARGHILVLTEKGELLTAPAQPEAFRPIARAQVLGFGTRPCPALARGHFYARDTSRLVCLDLRAP